MEDIPIVIGGKEYRTEHVRYQVMVRALLTACSCVHNTSITMIMTYRYRFSSLLSIICAPTPSLIPHVFTSENAMTNLSIVSGLPLANTFLYYFRVKEDDRVT